MPDGADLDPATLAACRSGDPEAFRRLVEAYRRPVLALCIALAGDDGEDLSQETFLRVHRAIHRFDPAGAASLRGWILCIARRLCHDRARALNRRGRVASIDDDTADTALDPGAALERADRNARVGRAIAALPDDQRAALALYEWEGLDYEAIAAREAVAVGTVRSRLSRARAALRVALSAVIAACGGRRSRSPSTHTPQEISMFAKLALALAAAAGAVVTIHVAGGDASPVAGAAARAPATQQTPAVVSQAAGRSAGPLRRNPAPTRHAAHEMEAADDSPCAGGNCELAADLELPERVDLAIAGAPSMGPATAKVTIVELVDFQCPFCEKALATVHDLAALYPDDVRIVVKNMPLDGHRQARGAALAALAAQRQGKYWEMHELLFANQERLDAPSLLDHARTLGLDIARFERDLADPAIAASVDADLAEAIDSGFRGVPSFTINGKVVVGALPLEQLRAVVDEELARARLSSAPR